jgi:streptogramin lyase
MRMATYTQSILHSPRDEGRETPEARETIIKWLSNIRGPGDQDPPIKPLSWPQGKATKVIITEYELPRLMIAPHDIAADAEGRIWYTPHRSPQLGRLDPATGVVTEYYVPDSHEFHPGTHGIWVDKQGMVWAGENWRQQTVKLDPRTGEFTVYPDIYICSLHPDGSFFMIREGDGDHAIEKYDTSGKVLKRWPLKVASSSYNCTLSKDGRYWGGGTWRDPPNVVVRLDTVTGELLELETRSAMSHPARAGFDPDGNLWLGGRLSNLIKFDVRTKQLREYPLPTPFNSFYEVTADDNGEAWGGEVHGGRVMRFNGRTEEMIEYVLPEPYAHSRRAWVDNSTDPVAYWYVDHNGYMVRVQPRE